MTSAVPAAAGTTRRPPADGSRTPCVRDASARLAARTSHSVRWFLGTLVAAWVVPALVESAVHGFGGYYDFASDELEAFLLPAGVLAFIFRRQLTQAARRLQVRLRARRGDGTPWSLDRDWDRRATERPIRRGIAAFPLVPAFFVAGWITAFAARPFLLPGPTTFVPRGAPAAAATPFPWPDPVVPGLAVGAAWCLFVLAVLPRLGKGRLVVAWPTFPVPTGGTAEFHVGTSDGGARIDGVRVLLRCVREAGAGPHRAPQILWVREAELARRAYVGPGADLRVRFDLPARLPPTDLRSPDAVYWELVVVGRVGANDYADCVLVPVYAATAAATAGVS